MVSVGALVTGTVLLPYLFPPQRGLVGPSADLGFNNGLSYLVYVALLPLPALVLVRLLPRTSAYAELTLSGVVSRVSWRLFTFVVVAHVVLFTAVYLYKGRFVFSEGLYFQSLLHRLGQGELPYLDFSYYYGPAMIYPALWLRAPLRPEAAYAVWYVATYLAGLLVLYVLLAAFVASRRVAALWFVFLAVTLFNPMTGVNFTFLRYLLPSLAFLAAADFLRSGGAGRFALATSLATFAYLYSFDTAILTIGAIATLAGLGIVRRPAHKLLLSLDHLLERERPLKPEATPDERSPKGSTGAARAALVLVSSSGASLGAVFLIDPTGEVLRILPETPIAYLLGAHNQPIYPHLLFLTLALASVIAVGLTLRAAARGTARASITVVAYLALALASQRASFSTSDPNHLVFFGLPVVLLCLHLSTTFDFGARIRTALLVAVLLGFALPLQAYHLSQLLPFARGVSQESGENRAEPPVRSDAMQAILTKAVSAVGTNRPYLMYGLTYYSVPVYQHFGLRYANYDTDFASARTPDLVSRMSNEVRRSGAYVIIRRSDLDIGGAVPQTDSLWNTVTVVTGAPLPGSDLRALILESDLRIRAPFLEFLRRDYRVIYEQDGVVVLAPRSG